MLNYQHRVADLAGLMRKVLSEERRLIQSPAAEADTSRLIGMRVAARKLYQAMERDALRDARRTGQTQDAALSQVKQDVMVKLITVINGNIKYVTLLLRQGCLLEANAATFDAILELTVNA